MTLSFTSGSVEQIGFVTAVLNLSAVAVSMRRYAPQLIHRSAVMWSRVVRCFEKGIPGSNHIVTSLSLLTEHPFETQINDLLNDFYTNNEQNSKDNLVKDLQIAIKLLKY